MRDIGKNIRDLRQQKGLTQEELAAMLYVTRQTISNYENGKSRPDVEMIGKIAEVLECDANTVFYGPPAAHDRKKDHWKMSIAVLLVGISGALLPWVRKQASIFGSLYFEPTAVMLVYLLAYPLWWFALGWTILYTVEVLLNVKRPAYPAFTVGKRILSALALLYLLLIIPYCIWCGGRIYAAPVHRDNPVPDVTRIKGYYDLIQRFLLLHLDHSSAYLFPGLLLRICQMPEKLAKPKE